LLFTILETDSFCDRSELIDAFRIAARRTSLFAEVVCHLTMLQNDEILQ
ncbi:unnamed protein product, partial [Litomosoides sigmodontis]